MCATNNMKSAVMDRSWKHFRSILLHRVREYHVCIIDPCSQLTSNCAHPAYLLLLIFYLSIYPRTSMIYSTSCDLQRPRSSLSDCISCGISSIGSNSRWLSSASIKIRTFKCEVFRYDHLCLYLLHNFHHIQWCYCTNCTKILLVP